MRLVDSTVETSVAHVRGFVRRYLEQRLADARGRIGAYGSRYANAMLTALDTSRCGAPQAPSTSDPKNFSMRLQTCATLPGPSPSTHGIDLPRAALLRLMSSHRIESV